MRKALDWCRSHPFVTSLGVVLIFGIGLHFFLDWRSEQRWQRYSAEARARGVKLMFVEFARPEIPDAENFAALPMLQGAFLRSARPFALPARTDSKPQFGNPLTGERIDWVVWQEDFLRAGFITQVSDDPIEDTLRGLEHYAPEILEWSEWRTRPRSHFALDMKLGYAMPIPHLGTFQDAVKVFSLRMRAHLARHDSTAAYADFQDGFQAYAALREEPTFIDGLVRISVLAVLISAVGDGLKDQAWAAEDLRKIQADLGRVRLWQEYRLALSSERGFANTFFDPLITASGSARRQMLAAAAAPATGANAASLFVFVPKRVFRDNQLRQNLFFDELLARIDPAGDHYDPDRETPSSPELMSGAFAEYYYFLCRMSASIYSSVEKKYVTMQNRLDHARMACALERFRQARGAFPATLDELVPEYLDAVPTDTYAKGPYHYHRTDPGSFRLYSVGPDRHDDGGVLDRKVSEKKQADDIWLYAPRGGGGGKGSSGVVE